MIDREKVIKAFEICYTSGNYCTICPLFQEDDCNDKLMRDVLFLLKEQEPRVLSKRYMQEWNKKEIDKRTPVVLECRETGYMRWVIETLYREEIDAIGEGDMRFWSARPTDEQRRAVPWNT